MYERDDLEPAARAAGYALAGWFALSMGMAIPLAFQHLERTFGAGPGLIGLVSAIFGGVQVLVRLPVGRWIDARGERGVLALSWVVVAAAGAGFWLAGSFVAASAAFVGFGVAVGLFWVGVHTLVSRLAPEGELARTMTRFQIVVGVGFMLGPPLGGVADLVGYRAALGGLVVAGLVGLVGHCLLPRVPFARVQSQAEDGVGSLWLGVLAAFFLGVLLGTSDTFVPVRLAAAGSTALGVGIFFTGRELANLLARLTSSRTVRDTNASAFLALGALAAGLGLLAFGHTLWAPGLGFAALGQGIGIGLVAPASLTLAASGSTEGGLGRAMGRHGAALGGGLLVGPLLLGPIGGVLGFGRLFDVAAGLAGLVALLAGGVWFRGRRQART